MWRLVLVPFTVSILGCGGVRPGIVNDGGGEAGQGQQSCDRREGSPECGGLGYDDVAITVTTAVVLALIVVSKLRQ